MQTGAYLKAPLDEVPLKINPAAFQGFADHCSAAYTYYETLLAGQGKESVLHLKYEDLAGPQWYAVVQDVFKFLGLDTSVTPRPLAVTVKQTVKPLASTISNYEELKYAFSCTQLASCFQGA